MEVIAAPGLPSWPPLKLDREKNYAEVVCWHPTWRSHERAIVATYVIVAVLLIGLAWQAYAWLPFSEVIDRVMAIIFGGLVVGGLFAFLLRQTLPPFLARRVFATRTVFCCNREAIQLRSCFYERPILLWRYWQGNPVQFGITVSEDPEAELYKSDLPTERNRNRPHLQSPRLISIVLGATSEAQPDSLRRRIPFVPMDAADAVRFSVVCQHAATLTNQGDLELIQLPELGRDIDTGGN